MKTREHTKWAKSRGFCEQCQHPWFDGLCTCTVQKTKEEEHRINLAEEEYIKTIEELEKEMEKDDKHNAEKERNKRYLEETEKNLKVANEIMNRVHKRKSRINPLERFN